MKYKILQKHQYCTWPSLIAAILKSYEESAEFEKSGNQRPGCDTEVLIGDNIDSKSDINCPAPSADKKIAIDKESIQSVIQTKMKI